MLFSEHMVFFGVTVFSSERKVFWLTLSSRLVYPSSVSFGTKCANPFFCKNHVFFLSVSRPWAHHFFFSRGFPYQEKKEFFPFKILWKSPFPKGLPGKKSFISRNYCELLHRQNESGDFGSRVMREERCKRNMRKTLFPLFSNYAFAITVCGGKTVLAKSFSSAVSRDFLPGDCGGRI